jgi:hypothetical protein
MNERRKGNSRLVVKDGQIVNERTGQSITAAPTGERVPDLTDLLREGQQRMRDMIAECEERGEKDRPFLIGCLQWIGLAEAALRAPSQPTSPVLQRENECMCASLGTYYCPKHGSNDTGPVVAAPQPSATAREVAEQIERECVIYRPTQGFRHVVCAEIVESYSARAVIEAEKRIEAEKWEPFVRADGSPLVCALCGTEIPKCDMAFHSQDETDDVVYHETCSYQHQIKKLTAEFARAVAAARDDKGLWDLVVKWRTLSEDSRARQSKAYKKGKIGTAEHYRALHLIAKRFAAELEAELAERERARK